MQGQLLLSFFISHKQKLLSFSSPFLFSFFFFLKWLLLQNQQKLGQKRVSPLVTNAFRKLNFYCFASGSHPRVIHFRKPYLKPHMVLLRQRMMVGMAGSLKMTCSCLISLSQILQLLLLLFKQSVLGSWEQERNSGRPYI